MALTSIRSVFFSFYPGLGGGETSLRALLGALDRKKHLPLVVCPREGQLLESVRALGIATRVVPYRGASRWFVPWAWERFPAVKRLKAALRDISPAVVHTDFHTLPYALPACRDLGIPLIFTCWGWWFHPLPWQRRFYRTGPDAILGMSEAIRRGFLGNPPFMPSDRVRLLYPGVDTSVFRPSPGNREDVRRELDVPKDAPLVTLLARFQEVKGHELFLEAARLIARRFPAARFVIAGENVFGGAGDEALKRRVISTVRADPVLRERVKFLGWVERTERLLAASDVLVCSSRFESFGMSLVEAMASEVPVVSTRVGGPSEIVAHAETGYLVDPGRADQIAEHVLALLEDSDLRARMGRAARIRAVERFELRDYVEGFSQVLEAVVSAG